MAVVVPAPHAPLAEQSLIEWTNAHVGKQQRIRGVVFRADLPRNANGKVLKRECAMSWRTSTTETCHQGEPIVQAVRGN